jgi:hypothetical protein
MILRVEFLPSGLDQTWYMYIYKVFKCKTLKKKVNAVKLKLNADVE